MATPVEIPKLGNTVEECIVGKWHKRRGDPVNAGDIVAEIETDKASFEVTAPVAGTLLAAFFDEGALVPVFTNLFVIGDPGENPEEFRPQSNSEKPHEPRIEPEAPRAVLQAATAVRPAAPLSPRARRFAQEHHVDPATVAGSGPAGRVLESDLRHAFFTSPRISPAAARHIQDGAQSNAPGSGAGGMVMASDLGSAAAATPLSTMRERIARRMRESLASTAQYTLHSSANAGGLLVLRARIKASQGLPDVNINDLIAFCTIRALLETPDLNAELIDGAIHRHSHVHLGFACDTPRGLMVPVVRNAHALAAGDLAARMKELAGQAVKGNSAPDDLSGATFTVSNLGGLGIESFTPLLNPPQVAILGVGAIQIKPVRRQGVVEFIDSIGLSLTCDHQVVDGAPGARFLQTLREKIEKVESLCTI